MRFLVLFICCFAAFSYCAQVDTIIFDYGEILNGKKMSKWVKKSLKGSRDELIHGIELRRKANDIGIPIDSIVPDFTGGVSQLVPNYWKEKLKEKIINTTSPFPGLFELTKQFESQGLQSAALINFRKKKDREVQRLGRFPLFEPHLYSYAIIARKSDPASYLYLLNEFNLIAEKCLFIDNDLQNVEVAMEIGMDAIYFRDHEDLKQQLRQREIYIY